MRLKNSFHILLMWRKRRVRRAQVSVPFVVGLFLFIFLYIPVSIWFMNQFYPEWHENRALKTEAARLAAEVRKIKPSPQQAHDYRQLVAALDRAESREGDAPPPDDPEDGVPEDVSELPAVESRREDPPQPETEPDVPGGIEVVEHEPFVEISEPAFRPNPQTHTMAVRFKVDKANTKANTVSGWIILVLVDNKRTPPARAVFPDTVELAGGAPRDYKQGDSFTIRNHKNFEVTLKNLSDPAAYTLAVIYAYDSEGRLMVKKVTPREPEPG